MKKIADKGIKFFFNKNSFFFQRLRKMYFNRLVCFYLCFAVISTTTLCDKTSLKYITAIGGGTLVGKLHEQYKTSIEHHKLQQSIADLANERIATDQIVERYKEAHESLINENARLRLDIVNMQEQISSVEQTTMVQLEIERQRVVALQLQLEASHRSNCRMRSLVNYWQNCAEDLEEERDYIWANYITEKTEQLTASNNRLTQSLQRSEETINNLHRQVYLLKQMQNLRLSPQPSIHRVIGPVTM